MRMRIFLSPALGVMMAIVAASTLAQQEFPYASDDNLAGARIGGAMVPGVEDPVYYLCDDNYGDALTGGCVPDGSGRIMPGIENDIDGRDYDCDELHAIGIGDIPVIGTDWMLLDGYQDFTTGEWISPPDGLACEWSGEDNTGTTDVQADERAAQVVEDTVVLKHALEISGFPGGPDSQPTARRLIETDDAAGCDEVGWSIDATRGQIGRPEGLDGAEAWRTSACQLGIEMFANCSEPFTAPREGIGPDDLIVACAVMLNSDSIGGTLNPSDFKLVPADNRRFWWPTDDLVWNFLNDYTHRDGPLEWLTSLPPNDVQFQYISFVIKAEDPLTTSDFPLRLLYMPHATLAEAIQSADQTEVVPIASDLSLWVVISETTPIDRAWGS